MSAGIRRTWKRLLDGHCGIVNVKDRDERYAEQPCQVAAVVPEGSRKNGGWTASEWLNRVVRLFQLTSIFDLFYVCNADILGG